MRWVRLILLVVPAPAILFGNFYFTDPIRRTTIDDVPPGTIYFNDA